jgi:peptidoglycan/LPS O-acetylase OafA/YrhL
LSLTAASTPASTGRRNKDLDRLRAVAILLVMVSHLQLVFPWGIGKPPGVFAYLGFWTGVDLFFVISGFIVSRLLVVELHEAMESGGMAVALKSFFARRIFRIWPLAWGWVAFVLLLSLVFNDSWALPQPGYILSEFVAIALNIYNLADAYGWPLLNTDGYQRFAPYWSLSVEEQFYLCMPILLLAVRTTRHRVWFLLAFLFFIVLVLRPVLVLTGTDVNFFMKFTLSRMDPLVCGCLLCFFAATAWHARIEPRVLKAPGLGLAVFVGLSAVVAIVPLLIGPNLDTARFTLFWPLLDLAAGLLVWIASYDGDYFTVPLLEPVIQWVGSRSYSLYLAHWPSIWITQEIGFRVSRGMGRPITDFGPLYLGLFVGLTLALAELGHRLVERPMNRKGHVIAHAIEAPAAQKAGRPAYSKR